MSDKRREALEKALFKLIGWPNGISVGHWPRGARALEARLILSLDTIYYYPGGDVLAVFLDGPEDLTPAAKLDLTAAKVVEILKGQL